MDLIEETVVFAIAIESGDWFTVETMTDDDFRYYDVMPDPVDKQTWLAFLEAIKRALPDLKLHLMDIKSTRDEVHCAVQMNGHHTQPLRLPLPDTKPIPPTLNHVNLPAERVIVKFKNGKVSEIRANYRLHTGLIGILEQLGVQ